MISVIKLPLNVTAFREERHTFGNEAILYAVWSRCGLLHIRFGTVGIDPAARQSSQKADWTELKQLYGCPASAAERTRLRFVISV
jgi:hypothetical protein